MGIIPWCGVKFLLPDGNNILNRFRGTLPFCGGGRFFSLLPDDHFMRLNWLQLSSLPLRYRTVCLRFCHHFPYNGPSLRGVGRHGLNRDAPALRSRCFYRLLQLLMRYLRGWDSPLDRGRSHRQVSFVAGFERPFSRWPVFGARVCGTVSRSLCGEVSPDLSFPRRTTRRYSLWGTSLRCNGC